MFAHQESDIGQENIKFFFVRSWNTYLSVNASFYIFAFVRWVLSPFKTWVLRVPENTIKITLVDRTCTCVFFLYLYFSA